MALNYQIIPVTPFEQNCSLLWCDETLRAAVVDPGGDIARLLSVVKSKGLTLEKILVTHGHIDHAGAVGELAERLSLPIEGPQREDDFWIENEAGQRIFKVDGKALRVRDTLKLKDMQGNVVAEIQEKVARVKDTMDIARGGKTIATVKKALVTPVRGRFSVNVAGGADMDVDGNVLGHEFKVTQGGREIAEISKKWFRVRDSYGVEIQAGQDDALLLAITVVIDQLTSDVG